MDDAVLRSMTNTESSAIDESKCHVSSEEGLEDDAFTLFPQPICGDGLDPLNWSCAQKHIILTIVMSMYFMFTYITTTTVPSFPTLQQKYSATLAQINWTVAIPAFGLSVGPLLWASPSDIIGRRPILVFGTAVALASTIGAALAPSYSGYMAARFFQGLGVSPASNVGLAVINDLFFEHERGQKVGLWVLAIDLGLLFGPLIGGIINFAGFAWIQWLSAIFFGVILFAELFFLPETLYPRHLMLSKIRRVRARQTDMEKIAVGISDMEEVTILKTKQLRFINLSPIPGLQHPKQYDAVVRFVKTFQYTVIPLAIITYCFGWYWWLLSIITLVPVAYAKYPPHIQGLLYLGLIFGTLVSEFCCSGGLSDRIVIKLASQNNKQKTPEMRIWLSYPAALLSAVGLIIWGISIDYDYHWMVGEFAFALFGAGIQMGNTAICSFVMDAYPMQSMATMTFYAVMLNLSAFAEPFFIVPWVENVGFTWTFAGQAFITLFFCVPVMVLIHRFGGVLREKSGRPTWVNSELEYSTAKS